jgi:trans-aconitate methyltransferase
MAANGNITDRWGEADPYERYVGRWSRRIAAEFVRWLALDAKGAWADVGCGTGALTEAVLRGCNPRSIHAIDKASGFVQEAGRRITDPRVRFEVADATALPMPSAACDAAVSALVLNFIGKPPAMVAEMARVTKPGGCVAAYVWDYAGGMQMMRYFWDAALATSPGASGADEAERFPICAPEPLRGLWADAGLQAVEVRSIEIPTVFADFDDYWQPFLGRQGAAPTWLAALDPQRQEAIRAALDRDLPRQPDGSIHLTATAWAVKGTLPA